MRRPATRWLWLGPAMVLAGVLGVVWWSWLPGRVAERAERELARRTGLVVRIGDVDMSVRGAVLEDVRLTPRLGAGAGAISVVLDEVGVRVGIWKAIRGITSVEYVQVRGGKVVVDLAHQDLDEALAGLRRAREPVGASRSAEERARTARGEPVLEVQGLRVLVRDRYGALVEAGGLSVGRDGDAVRLACSDLALGSEGGDRLALERAFVSVKRDGDGRLRLESLVADHGEVRWAAPPERGGSVDADAGPVPLAARLRAAFAEVARSPGEEETSPEATDEASTGILARLSPDIRVDLGDLTFHGRARDGSATTMRFTELLVGRTDDGRLHSVGSGDGGANGSARWNLVFDPATARAEGDLRFDALPMGFVAPLIPFVPFHPTPDGRLSADLRLRVTRESNVEIEGRVAVLNAALSSRRIADRPVTGISVSLDGEGVWHPAEKKLVWRSGRLRSGEVEVRLSGELAVTDEAYQVRFEGTLPPTSCQAVVDAIPRDVLGPVASFRLAGRMGGRALVRVDSRRLAHTEVEIGVADGCEFIAVPAIAETYRFESAFAHQVVEPDGSVFTMTTGPGTGNWAPFGAIHPNLITAILSHEDASFYAHSGFAPWAIREALVRNLEARAFRYGASTISMQLTKNLFLRREKTLVRKVQEVFLTWWLERALEKHRILELYLNVIEYGPGLYGIRNATRHYFGREPSDVSPAEAAFLANVLPSPKSYGGMYQSGVPSASMLRRMEQFLRHMHARGRIGAEALAYGLAELPTFRFHHEGAPPPPPRVLPGDRAAHDYGGGEGEESIEDEWSVPEGEGAD